MRAMEISPGFCNRYSLVSVIFGRCLVIYMSYTITIYNVLYLYIRNNIAMSSSAMSFMGSK